MEVNRKSKPCGVEKSVFMLSEFPQQNFLHALREQQNAFFGFWNGPLQRASSLIQTHKQKMERGLSIWRETLQAGLLPSGCSCTFWPGNVKCGQDLIRDPSATQLSLPDWPGSEPQENPCSVPPCLCIQAKSPAPAFVQTLSEQSWQRELGEAGRWGTQMKLQGRETISFEVFFFF